MQFMSCVWLVPQRQSDKTKGKPARRLREIQYTFQHSGVNRSAHPSKRHPTRQFALLARIIFSPISRITGITRNDADGVLRDRLPRDPPPITFAVYRVCRAGFFSVRMDTNIPGISRTHY